MYTDPKRIHASDPGRVKGNPVFIYLDIFGKDVKKIEDFKERYKGGKMGDIEVKKYLVKVLNDFLGPIRVKRKELKKDTKLVKNILTEGGKKTKIEAEKTINEVKEKMGLT